jgi:hypothetical protein
MSRRGPKINLVEALEDMLARFSDDLVSGTPSTPKLEQLYDDVDTLLLTLNAIKRPWHGTVKPGPKKPINMGTQRPVVKRSLQKTERRLLALINSDPKRLWATIEVVHNSSGSEKSLKYALTNLVRDGYLVRPRRGFYHSVRSGPDSTLNLSVRPRVERELGPSEQAVFDLISKNRQASWATQKLVTETELPRSTVKNCLIRLTRDGFVTRAQRGFYRAAIDPVPAHGDHRGDTPN